MWRLLFYWYFSAVLYSSTYPTLYSPRSEPIGVTTLGESDRGRAEGVRTGRRLKTNETTHVSYRMGSSHRIRRRRRAPLRRERRGQFAPRESRRVPTDGRHRRSR